MTGTEVINGVREIPLDDSVEPYLWSNATLVNCLNDALDEMCERAFILTDSSSLDICRWYVGIQSSWWDVGTNAATIQVTTAFDFLNTVAGESPKLYTFPITDNIEMTACSEQAVSKYCRYLISSDADYNVTVTKGDDASTAAAAVLPELPSEETPIGILLIATDATHTFTSGTNSLDDTGITATFVSSDTTFETDGRVVRINRIKLVNQAYPLPIKDIYWMDDNYTNWEWYDTDDPRILVKRKDRKKYSFFPPALYPDLAVLTVARRQLTPVTVATLGTELEIDDMYAKRLSNGIASMAYLKQGTETFDAEAAKNFKALWYNDLEEMKIQENQDEQRDETNILPYGAY